MLRPDRMPIRFPTVVRLTERHQRAEVAVPEGLHRLFAEPPFDLAGQMGSLLMRGLRPRRHRSRCARLRTGGAIADREKSGSRVD